MKNSLELKQEIKSVYDQIEKLNNEEKPDFESIEGLQSDVKQLEKQLNIREEIEARKAKNIEIETRASAFANVHAGNHKNMPKDELEVYKNFSIINAVRQISKGGTLQGAEAEAMAITQEEAVHSGVKLTGNIGIPQKLFSFPGKKKAVDVATEGANIVDTMFGPKIPLLEIDPQVIRAGSRVFTGQSSNLQFPRGETGAVVLWEGEVDPSASTDPTYGNIQLTPHRLAAYTDFSIQANTQASFDLEADLRQRLASAASIEWDRAALLGSGSLGEPKGILDQAGIGIIPSATNSVDWATAVAFISSLSEANVQMDGPLAYMGTSGIMAHLLTQPKDAGSGLFVMSDAMRIAGFPFYVDNNMPTNGGTSTDQHTLLFGKWSDNYMAQWNGSTILYDPYSQAVSGSVRLVLNMYLDNNVSHVESFAACFDILP